MTFAPTGSDIYKERNMERGQRRLEIAIFGHYEPFKKNVSFKRHFWAAFVVTISANITLERFFVHQYETVNNYIA